VSPTPPAWRKPLERAAARARSVLGIDALARRQEAVESRLTAMSSERWPHPPVYMGDHTAVVATRWGAKMLVDTSDTILAPWLLLDGLWEADLTAWIQSTLRPGQVFVDIGANIGYFTLLGGRLVGETGRVVAIEAHPRLARLLRRNIVMNDLHRHVTSWHRAAWSEPTTLKFHLRVHFPGNSSAGSVGSDWLEFYDDEEEVVDVEAVAMDDLLADVPRVDVVKVDVEGAEIHVVAGMERTLKANPAIVVVFEWSPGQMVSVGDTPAALLDLLGDHGFSYQLIGDHVTPLDRARLLDLPYGNIVAARSSR
jgi:FkbM family methyltransferase